MKSSVKSQPIPKSAIFEEDSLMQSQIRDIQLAPSGQAKINWVKNHMPILNQLEEDFLASQPFAGKKVAICLHLEAKKMCIRDRLLGCHLPLVQLTGRQRHKKRLMLNTVPGVQ